MICSHCRAQNPDDASFCANCGMRLVSPLPSQPATASSPQQTMVQTQAHRSILTGELADFGQRIGSWLLDAVLQVIPYLGLIPYIVNLVLNRRGSTIGLSVARARIIRDNGDVSGFYHTSVRTVAAVLSAIPLGLGYWWAFWDPMRQTWHDKIMHTLVVKDTPEIAARKGTSSHTAVVVFWVLSIISLVILLLLLVFLGVSVVSTLNSFM